MACGGAVGALICGRKAIFHIKLSENWIEEDDEEEEMKEEKANNGDEFYDFMICNL